MNGFLKNVLDGKGYAESKRYFLRFGKGRYNRRFRISLNKGKNIKVRASYEFANDFVKLVNEIKGDIEFDGKIYTMTRFQRENGGNSRKKGGTFALEVSAFKTSETPDAYFSLLNVKLDDLVLKMKKSLPKPGKEGDKIDDKFCSLDLDLKYLDKVKEIFFWDVPDCKKAKIEHDIIVDDVEFPKGEEDPTKIRELAIRKGKIVRRIDCEGDVSEKEYKLAI